MKFEVERQTVYGHRAILSVRSKYFKAMFTHDQKSGREGEVGSSSGRQGEVGSISGREGEVGSSSEREGEVGSSSGR